MWHACKLFCSTYVWPQHCPSMVYNFVNRKTGDIRIDNDIMWAAAQATVCLETSCFRTVNILSPMGGKRFLTSCQFTRKLRHWSIPALLWSHEMHMHKNKTQTDMLAESAPSNDFNKLPNSKHSLETRQPQRTMKALCFYALTVWLDFDML